MIPGGYLSGTRWIWYIVGESGVCGLILPSAVQCSAGKEGEKEGMKEEERGRSTAALRSHKEKWSQQSQCLRNQTG